MGAELGDLGTFWGGAWDGLLGAELGAGFWGGAWRGTVYGQSLGRDFWGAELGAGLFVVGAEVSSVVGAYVVDHAYCREMVKLLVTHGANINLHGGSDWWTPLFYASMAGS